TVTFYAAGNAANNNFSSEGDNIYTTSVSITAMVTTPTPPTLSSIQPTSGPAAGGTNVTIVGTGFTQGLSVRIGSRDATVLSVANRQIMATTQPNDPGTVDV